MTVKLLLDFLSQPSRAVVMFCRAAKIPHEVQQVRLGKRENRSPEFTKIQPLQTVPALLDGDVCLKDSSAMMRYLSRKFNVDDHWYPKDLVGQARVDEYLHWQHNNTRLACSTYFWEVWLYPIQKREASNPATAAKHLKIVNEFLDKFENVWLENGNKDFLCGDQISVADIMACCELEQPSVAGLDVRKNRAIVAAYMKRVKKELKEGGHV